jgi:NADH dehydrogenase [ubiquinone] 1 alpha subcomplex assembly factor 7
MHDVFHTPGHSDITANVDFAYLREALLPFSPSPSSSQLGRQSQAPASANLGGHLNLIPTNTLTQTAFLLGMGLRERFQQLMRHPKMTEEQKANVRSAAERLVDLKGMGGEYKVLGFVAGEGKSLPERNLWPFKAAHGGDGMHAVPVDNVSNV